MSRLPRRWRLSGLGALGAGIGLITAQGLAPMSLWPLTVLGLVALGLLFSRTQGAWPTAVLGWAFGAGYFAWGLRWIVEPFQVDAAAHAWMAPFALVFMAGGLALFWGAAFFGAERLIPRRMGHPVARQWVLVGAVSLAELARGYVLTGFPWANLSQALVGDALWAALPWIGAPGITLAACAATLPLASLWSGAGRVGLSALVVPGVIAATGTFAALQLPASATTELTQHYVRLVQPNAPQDEKWDPQKRWVFFERQLEFTAAPGDVDLVVWPETAVPSLLNYADGFAPMMQQAAAGVPLVYGIQREEAGRYFNSAVVMDETGQSLDIYDKVHLVPFGEYMPLSDLAARFGVFGLAARANAGYAPGAGRGLLDLTVGRALPLICYEAVFGQDVNATDERPELLILITNDAWFGLHAGPQQHLVQAQMRAAEQGLPMVRVANTGISAMIDPYGRLREALPLNTAGFVDAALPAPLAATLYSRWGDWPVLLLSLLCLTVPVAVRRRRQSGPAVQKRDC